MTGKEQSTTGPYFNTRAGLLQGLESLNPQGLKPRCLCEPGETAEAPP